MRKLYILAVAALFVAGYALSAARMESRLTQGTEVLLALEPVDPRALLMGDYMVLEYAVNRVIMRAMPQAHVGPDVPSAGRAVMRLLPPRKGGAAPEARFRRLDDGSPLAGDEVFLAFVFRKGAVTTAPTAFYFAEGRGAVYESSARFGLVRLDRDGRATLAGLCDGNGALIRAERPSR